ncbi:hypothetical protein FDENT_9625 [Fusarium denticulatum]|uniref:JmjC domain-containing protein n=1 Tax=Fusarium denticulatum TaxID=48507 RepID=A0A8H5TSU6_9HYPO|nr:hypothetical protein FDENT_9625 [Fusarium denticulatum]
MSTQSPPIISASDPLVTKLDEFYSCFNALLDMFRNEIPPIPQPKRQTRSASLAEAAEQEAKQAAHQRENLAESLRTVERGMASLKSQLEAIILQAKDAEAKAQNFNLPGIAFLMKKSMSQVTNRPQMDTRSEPMPHEQCSNTRIRIPEQEVSSRSRASETSSPQPTQTPDDQQTVESEVAIMTGHKGGDNDAQNAAQPPITPSPTRRARVGLNTKPGSMAFGRSYSVVSESTSCSMAADTSPVGSIVTTYITSPESSPGACKQDEIMSDVDTVDGQQTGQSFAGGLNVETDQSPTADTRAYQSPRSHAANDEANDEASSRMHEAHDRTGPPSLVTSDSTPHCNDDDLGQVLDIAMGMLPTTTANPQLQAHSAVHGDDQHTEDQRVQSLSDSSSREESDGASKGAELNTRPNTPPLERSSQSQASEAVDTSPASSVATCTQNTAMLGVEGPDATSAETAIVQRPQRPAANETSEADSVANSAAYSPGSRQSSPCPNRTTGDADQRDTGPMLPTLSPADMTRLISKIQELEAQGCGQHISVPPVDVDLEDIKKSIDTGKWRCTSCEYRVDHKGRGYVKIYADVPTNQPLIDWSAFSAEFKRPTTDEAKAVFENTVQNPPEGKIPYYIGHADILSEQLDPGPPITGNPDLDDIHSNYQHIGGHRSGNRIHWEDFTYLDETDNGPIYRGLRSFNQVYFGTGCKLWLVIAKHHITKFDAFARKTWQCRECIGGISHKCLFLAPSSLEKASIDFNIYVVGRGEAVWTLPGQQHSIINVGHCAARSMNFLYPGESIEYKKLAHCLECDQHPISIKHGIPLVSTERDKKRKQHQAHSDFPLKKTRTNTALRRELVEIEQGLAGIPYRRINIDRQHPSTAEVKVYKRVAAVRSTMAIQQFITLVKDWKNEEATVHINKAQDKLNQSVESVKFFERKTNLSKFGLRLTQRKLAHEADMAKGPIQRQLETGLLDKLAAAHCMTKKRLKDHIEDGRQWNFICKSHDGLLPFIFLDSKNPFGIKKDDWANLYRKENEADADAFRSLLDDEYTGNLCEAGRIFEERVSEKIFNGSVLDTGGFVWEETELDVDSENINELLKQVTRREGT